MLRKIVLDGQEIIYDLTRKNVKNINLRIKPDQSIYLSANKHVTQKIIDDFLISKSDFILNALSRFKELEKQLPKAKQYIDGEQFSYLGEICILKVAQGSKNKVENNDSYITLTVKDISDVQLKKRVMNKWLRQQCQIVVTQVCKSVYPQFEEFGIAFPELRFRKMVSLWGSCQPIQGVLTFNTALIETPLSCIEYVVTHEFTHFIQPDHSKVFYQHLSHFMPDWVERKNILKKYVLYKD